MFITLEGIDGCGKSTQAALLANLLAERRDVVRTREPGGWPEGGALRELLLHGGLCGSWTEVLLFVADRCEHASKVILPALRRGETVICERYNDSTLAYQCWGRGLDREKVEALIDWCGLPQPEVTLWFDLPVELALSRRTSRGGCDRFEAQELAFHRRIAQGFAELSRETGRIVRIDGAQSEADVTEQMVNALRQRGVQF